MPSVVANTDGVKVTTGSVAEVIDGAQVTCATAGLIVKVTEMVAARKVEVAADEATTTQLPAVVQVKTAVVALTEQFEVLDGLTA